MATISEAANMTLVINSSSILRLRVFLTEQKNTCSCFSKKKNPQKKEIFGKRLFQPLQRKGGALVLARPAFFQSHAHHTFLGTHTHTLSLSLSRSLSLSLSLALSQKKNPETVSVAHNAYIHPSLKNMKI